MTEGHGRGSWPPGKPPRTRFSGSVHEDGSVEETSRWQTVLTRPHGHQAAPAGPWQGGVGLGETRGGSRGASWELKDRAAAMGGSRTRQRRRHCHDLPTHLLWTEKTIHSAATSFLKISFWGVP